jgi:hypothetical protein
MTKTMTLRVILLASDILVILSVAVGLQWWATMWRRGALADVWSETIFPYLFAFAAMPLLALIVMIVILQRAHRGTSEWPDRRILFMAFGLFCSSLFYYVTPMLGALALFLLCLLAAKSLLWNDSSSELEHNRPQM